MEEILWCLIGCSEKQQQQKQKHYIASAKVAQLVSKHEKTLDKPKLWTFCKIASLKYVNVSSS